MSKLTRNKLAWLALAGLGAVTSGPALAGGMTVDSKGGVEVFELDDNSFWFKLSGRLMFDQVFFDTEDDNNNGAFPSGAHIRSARATLKGGVGRDWVYKFDIDLRDNPGSTNAGFGEAYIGYSGCKDFWVAIGQVSIPFGLENWASSTETTFMELSLPSSAFAPDKGLGLYAEWHGHMFTAAAALYHPPAGSIAYGDVLSVPITVAGEGPFDSDPGSDDIGFGARVTFSPLHDDYTVYHAGASGRWEHLHEHANNFGYFATYEVFARQTPFIFTNIPPNSTKEHHVYGLELAGRWGPLLVQGEYMWADVERDAVFLLGDTRNPGGDLDYHGYYVAASYVLTGETREYDFDSGTFGGVHPQCRKGAWEIAVRHSFVELNDGNLSAAPRALFIDPPTNSFSTGISVNDIVGAVHSTTIGLNWYVNDNIKFMLNYVRTDLPESDDVDALGFRAQVVW